MMRDNIFSRPFKTRGGAIPFDRITTADYEPGQPPNTFCGKNPDFLRNFSPFLRAKKVINM